MFLEKISLLLGYWYKGKMKKEGKVGRKIFLFLWTPSIKNPSILIWELKESYLTYNILIELYVMINKFILILHLHV